jgi:hypothetical protein
MANSARAFQRGNATFCSVMDVLVRTHDEDQTDPAVSGNDVDRSESSAAFHYEFERTPVLETSGERISRIWEIRQAENRLEGLLCGRQALGVSIDSSDPHASAQQTQGESD